MAKKMKLISLFSTGITMLCIALYVKTKDGLFLTLGITFGTTSYHFIMRLLVGFSINCLFHNRIDYRKKWFQVSKGEERLYRKIRVKNWKEKMATYDPDCFDRSQHSWHEIAQATCQAELVHEVIILFSFVPILAAIPFGTLIVFVITSVLAACYDALFVIMQRYNRPRILRLAKKSRGERE